MDHHSSVPMTPSEALLAQHAWVRRLARTLVRDAALADDVAQEACLRALERPPGEGGNLRQWLGGIARNVARQWRREGGRRTSREQAHAHPEATTSASEALVCMAAQQEVVRAVLALEEPYRATVVLRYYEGLAPRVIARREGVPLATVKSRLARGLAQLRARLDGEHGGDGRRWALALAPLLARRALPIAQTVLFAGATVAASTLVWLAPWRLRDEPATRVVEPAPAPLALAQQAILTGAREALVPQGDSLEVPLEPAASTFSGRTVTGLVIDVEGRAAAGVALALRTSSGSSGSPLDHDFGRAIWSEEAPDAEQALVVSALDGTFSCSLPDEVYGRFVSCDPDFETVLAPFAGADSERVVTVVVAPTITLSGGVRDQGGAPLSGVELAFAVPSARIASGAADLYNTLASGWQTTSDAAGRFSLRVPAVAGGKLRARLAPYETELVVREHWEAGEVELTLALPAGEWLQGRVVDHAGLPLAGATVALGTEAVRSDAEGVFRIPLAGREQETKLVASAPGRRAVRFVGTRDASGKADWSVEPLLRLEHESLALAGRVSDETGAPLAQAKLWLLDGEVVALAGVPYALESFAAGPESARHGVRSAEDGTFQLEGLEARAYRLLVVEAESALTYELGPFEAGRADLELVRPADALLPRVRGVVRDDLGVPLAGVELGVEVDLPVVGLGDIWFGHGARGARTTSDAEGLFELACVPRRRARLEVFDARFVDGEFTIDDPGAPLALELVLVPWTDLQVDVHASFPEADSCHALDEDGQVVRVRIQDAGSITITYELALQGGRSRRVGIAASARTLVLLRGEEELARIPIVLERGALNALVL